MPGTTIVRGNVLFDQVLTCNLTPVAVGANTTAEQSFTVPGLISGDCVTTFQYLSAFPTTTGIDVVNIRVPSANTMTVAYQNNLAAGTTPPSGNYYIEVKRLDNLPAPANLV